MEGYDIMSGSELYPRECAREPGKPEVFGTFAGALKIKYHVRRIR